jgi:hypothetical protein
MGHSSPTITLRTYAYLLPDDDTTARGALQGALQAAVSPVCHGQESAGR